MISSMSIACSQCGYENREHYRFCGRCGTLLSPSRVQATVPAAERVAAARSAYPAVDRTNPQEPVSNREVSGPSFLGLSEPAPSRGVEYLLEDEESDHAGRRRMYAALLLLLMAAAVVFWRWRGGEFAWVKRFVATQSGSTPPVQSNPSITNGPPVGQGASSPPTPSMPMASSGTETTSSSTPPPPPSEESHMVNPDEASTGRESQPVEKKATPPSEKQNADNRKTASDQDASDQADQAAGGNEAVSTEESDGDDTAAPAEAEKKTASNSKAAAAAPTKAAKAAVSEPAPPPTNSADDSLVAAGEKYLYGNGASENCGLAQKNLQAAAAHSNARALSMLGAMYATGHCTNRDLSTAYKYFAKALHQDPNNGRIQRDLEVLWRQMNASERQAATRN